jgi:hypothetical protein
MTERIEAAERMAAFASKGRSSHGQPGVRGHAPGREGNDFYRTPPHVTEALLRVESFPDLVWEPACGDGAMADVLEQAGYFVTCTDLIDRGRGEAGRDFLAEPALLAPAIITNPPFRIAEDFVTHALALGASHVAMLLRLAWLEGAKRRDRVFAPHPPARVWVMSKRPTLWNGSDPNPRTTGGAMAYAWFVWDRGAEPGTRLGWL